MKVNAYIDITLDKNQKREITIEFLEERFGIKSNYFIKDDNLCYYETYPGTGFKPDLTIIREATDLDRCIVKILDELEDDKYV